MGRSVDDSGLRMTICRNGLEGTSPEGQDIQLLTDSVRPPPRSREDRLHAQFEFTAHRNGELFLFVNDAVPLLLIFDFYANNRGSAKIGVEQLAWTSGPVDPIK